VTPVLQIVFSLETVYLLTGLVLLAFACLTFVDKRHPCPAGSAAFWLILGVIFIFASRLPHAVTGLLVLALVALDGANKVRPGVAEQAERPEGAAPIERKSSNVGVLNYERNEPIDKRIFLPVLTIPLVTVLLALVFRLAHLDVTQGALIGLGFGGVAAMAVALRLTRSRVRTLLDDGRRLNECMGTVNILPQLLASLGVIFAAAGVGQLIARGIVNVVPRDQLFLLVLANCLGMTLFTIAMGNSFAAFPVIAAGVLVPLIVAPFHVDPAMAAIITLTAGSSGTLITPMAANFNIVPAALLELRNPYAVLRFQLPFALVLWPLHVLVMYCLIRIL
jgi:uncharacterized membrane protein